MANLEEEDQRKKTDDSSFLLNSSDRCLTVTLIVRTTDLTLDFKAPRDPKSALRFHLSADSG